MAYDKQTPTLRLLTASGEHRIGWGRVVGYALLVAALIAMLVPGFARAQPPERRWAEARILVQPKAGLPEEHFGVGRLGGDCDRGDRRRTNAGVGRPGWRPGSDQRNSLKNLLNPSPGWVIHGLAARFWA